MQNEVYASKLELLRKQVGLGSILQFKFVIDFKLIQSTNFSNYYDWRKISQMRHAYGLLKLRQSSWKHMELPIYCLQIDSSAWLCVEFWFGKEEGKENLGFE